MNAQPSPIVLKGRSVRLEPLSQDHAQGLFNRGRSTADWAYMPRECFVDMADMRQWIAQAEDAAGQIAFAIVETAKNKAIGSTRYLNIRPEHCSIEIGWTWLGSEWQRTGINTEAKYLLLGHAFERLGCLRVEFKADARNLRSQAALERIGAVREGVLRQHMIVQNNFSRDSVYYSVLHTEWPRVKAHLAQMIDKY